MPRLWTILLATLFVATTAVHAQETTAPLDAPAPKAAEAVASPPAAAAAPADSAPADGATTSAVTAADFRPSNTLVLRLDDRSINPVTARFITATIDRAEAENALLVILLDTPGGLVQSTRDIVKRILASRVPVVTYVHPSGARAASAGMFITVASHVAAMTPGTNIGAAHVVGITGSWPGRGSDKGTTGSLPGFEGFPQPPSGDSVMEEKVMNDITAWIRGIAHLRGRNTEWAQEAVRESSSITADEAVARGVVDFIATDLDDLMRQLEGRTVAMGDNRNLVIRTAGTLRESVEMTGRQRILDLLANPSVALLLLFIGFAGLAYEITHPGLFVPGTVGIISLLLAALALNMLPTNWAAILLILAGLALIAAEIKITSYGLLTAAGAVCLFFGAVALFDQPAPFTGVPMGIAAALVGSIVALMAILVFLVVRTHVHRPQIGLESMVGMVGEVRRDLSPDGKVFCNGTYWDAVAATPLPAGTRVRVLGVKDGMVLVVEKLT